MQKELVIDGTVIKKGESKRFEIVVSKLFDHTEKPIEDASIEIKAIAPRKKGNDFLIRINKGVNGIYQSEKLKFNENGKWHLLVKIKFRNDEFFKTFDYLN